LKLEGWNFVTNIGSIANKSFFPILPKPHDFLGQNPSFHVKSQGLFLTTFLQPFLGAKQISSCSDQYPSHSLVSLEPSSFVGIISEKTPVSANKTPHQRYSRASNKVCLGMPPKFLYLNSQPTCLNNQ
jgi:hypothetical protein